MHPDWYRNWKEVDADTALALLENGVKVVALGGTCDLEYSSDESILFADTVESSRLSHDLAKWIIRTYTKDHTFFTEAE